MAVRQIARSSRLYLVYWIRARSAKATLTCTGRCTPEPIKVTLCSAKQPTLDPAHNSSSSTSRIARRCQRTIAGQALRTIKLTLRWATRLWPLTTQTRRHTPFRNRTRALVVLRVYDATTDRIRHWPSRKVELSSMAPDPTQPLRLMESAPVILRCIDSWGMSTT